MKRNNVVKGAKTIYAANPQLWEAFTDMAYQLRISTSSLIEVAMGEYLLNHPLPPKRKN
jgi:hypothetical protein